MDVTKIDEVRTVPMVKEFVEVLQKYKDSLTHEYVFINPKTQSYYRDTRSIVDTYYKPLLQRLELPNIVMYQTRATFASISTEKGIPLSITSSLVKSIRMIFVTSWNLFQLKQYQILGVSG